MKTRTFKSEEGHEIIIRIVGTKYDGIKPAEYACEWYGHKNAGSVIAQIKKLLKREGCGFKSSTEWVVAEGKDTGRFFGYNTTWGEGEPVGKNATKFQEAN